MQARSMWLAVLVSMSVACVANGSADPSDDEPLAPLTEDDLLAPADDGDAETVDPADYSDCQVREMTGYLRSGVTVGALEAIGVSESAARGLLAHAAEAHGIAQLDAIPHVGAGVLRAIAAQIEDRCPLEEAHEIDDVSDIVPHAATLTAFSAKVVLPTYGFVSTRWGRVELPLGLSAADVKAKQDGPTFLDPGLVELGNLLFFDRRLSSSKKMSCATCHVPGHGYAATTINRGVHGNLLERTTPAATNRIFGTENTWLGGRTLNQQSVAPILAHGEMNMTEAKLRAAVLAVPGYRVRFNELAKRGRLPGAKQVATTADLKLAHIALALEVFQQSLLTGGSRVDRYEAGLTDALTPDEIAGRTLFHGKAGCVRCHSGSNYSNEGFHNIVSGCPSTNAACVQATPTFEAGRYLVTKDRADLGKFKTPSLRNVARRGPYFHSGVDLTLEKVVRGYDEHSDLEHIGQDGRLKNTNLTPVEESQLVAFLKALNGPIPVVAELSVAGTATSSTLREHPYLSPRVFDVAYYRSHNADIPGIAAMTDNELKWHWLKTGIGELRPSALGFHLRDVKTLRPIAFSATQGLRDALHDPHLTKGRVGLSSHFFNAAAYRAENAARLAFRDEAYVTRDFLTRGLAEKAPGHGNIMENMVVSVGTKFYRVSRTAKSYCALADQGGGVRLREDVWPYFPSDLTDAGTCPP